MRRFFFPMLDPFSAFRYFSLSLSIFFTSLRLPSLFFVRSLLVDVDNVAEKTTTIFERALAPEVADVDTRERHTSLSSFFSTGEKYIYIYMHYVCI